MVAKKNGYPKGNSGQTQDFQSHGNDGKEDAEGGKLRQRESDVSYIVDNQIAESRHHRRGPVKK